MSLFCGSNLQAPQRVLKQQSTLYHVQVVLLSAGFLGRDALKQLLCQAALHQSETTTIAGMTPQPFAAPACPLSSAFTWQSAYFPAAGLLTVSCAVTAGTRQAFAIMHPGVEDPAEADRLVQQVLHALPPLP